MQITPFHSFDYGGATYRVYHAFAGHGLNKHEHANNHAVLCHAGACSVRVKGKEYILTKTSQPMDLPAYEPHEIEALEDGTVFVNVFAEGKY